MKPTDTLAQAAFALCVKGYSVIPIVPKDKVPAIPWKRYQERAASPEQVMRWWQVRPDYNVAMVTGLVSGLSVCDYDPRHDPTGATLAKLQTLLHEPTVRTGGGGLHWYVKIACASVPRLLPGLDFKSNGGYVICPPSIHPSGEMYLSLRPDVLAMPEELRAMVKRAEIRMVGEGRKSKSNSRRTPPAEGLSLDEVLVVLQGVKQTSKGWLACCPAHDDHSPSLSVGEGHDGRLLLRCWVGCSFSDVTRALRDRQARHLVRYAQSLQLR